MKRALAVWGVPLACLILIGLLIGLHSEYAPWLARRAIRAASPCEALQVWVEGGVSRKPLDGSAGINVWATQPEFTVRIVGASPQCPVRICNVPARNKIETVSPGVISNSVPFLLLTTPGVYSFRPKQGEAFLLRITDEPTPTLLTRHPRAHHEEDAS